MTELLVNEITVPNSMYKTKEFIFLIFLESVTNFDSFPAVVTKIPAINFRIWLLRKSLIG